MRASATSVLVTVVALTGTAVAGPAAEHADDTAGSDQQLVLLNASAKLGDRGQIDRIRRVLDSRGLLMRLPERLEAQLDGRNVLIADVEAIRDSYAKLDFAMALQIVESDEKRILEGAVGGDPIPALAQLAEWRGLISSGMEQPDEAVRWFRAALRLNPAWTPDKKLAGPRVRPLIKKARKEIDETGRLKIDADPDTAQVSIDGGKAQAVTDKIVLPIGIHLAMITAEGHGTYAELVEIKQDKTEKIEIALDKETKSDKAARLVDATITAPPGKARLKRAKALSMIAGGATRFLVIEEGNDEKVTVRLYDTTAKKVSRPLEFDEQASSASIARKVLAALDPDNMVEPTSVMVIERQRSQRWYEHWYVWAGVAAVAGGGYLGYHMMTREPESVRGF